MSRPVVLPIEEGVEDHFEGGVGLAAVLGADSEEDEVASAELDIDDGGTVGDVLFAEQPAGGEDLGRRVFGDYAHLRIADVRAAEDGAGLEPESLAGTQTE